MTKKTLGKAVGKPVGVSVVGIIDYSGAYELYQKALELHKKILIERNLKDSTIINETRNVDRELPEKIKLFKIENQNKKDFAPIKLAKLFEEEKPESNIIEEKDQNSNNQIN